MTAWARGQDYTWCPTCGKRGYYSRKDGKAALRRFHAADKGMREYRCPATPALWHIGHMPDIVRRRGTVSAAAIYASPYRQRRAES